MVTTIDRAESADFRSKLDAALRGRVLDTDGQFVCRHQGQCTDSATRSDFGFAGGQLSYVGDAYSCRVEGRPFRVLVVSMQVGDAEAPVDMDRRHEQVVVRIPERPGLRNPHLRGVTRALQILHGLPPEAATEKLPDGTHVLSAYAMANSSLCSCLPTGGKSRRGSPTKEMLLNCGDHLLTTIASLQPAVIHTQGADTAVVIERLATAISWRTDNVARLTIAGVEAVLCALSHPSAGPPKSWSSLKPGAYFATVARPSLELARTMALAVDRSS